MLASTWRTDGRADVMLSHRYFDGRKKNRCCSRDLQFKCSQIVNNRGKPITPAESMESEQQKLIIAIFFR